MMEGSKGPGTHCKILHKLCSILSCITHLSFIIAGFFPGLNTVITAEWIPYLIPEKIAVKLKIKCVASQNTLICGVFCSIPPGSSPLSAIPRSELQLSSMKLMADRHDFKYFLPNQNKKTYVTQWAKKVSNLPSVSRILTRHMAAPITVWCWTTTNNTKKAPLTIQKTAWRAKRAFAREVTLTIIPWFVKQTKQFENGECCLLLTLTVQAPYNEPSVTLP